MNWVDRWARRAAARDAAEPVNSGLPETPPSRRDFLKRAAAVSAAVWTVPVLQTVMAPAASASPATPLGQPCNDLGTCNGGTAYCNGATCGGVGAICPAGICASGVNCSPLGDNICGGQWATCTDGADCTGGSCRPFLWLGDRCW